MNDERLSLHREDVTGRLFRQWRTNHRVTLKEAAYQLGITDDTLSRIENESQGIGPATLASMHRMMTAPQSFDFAPPLPGATTPWRP